MSEHWSILVHGGAKTIPSERRVANRSGCLAALAAGEAVLDRGGAAIDAVAAAIKAMEDDVTFNAGRGAVRNVNGDIELDAALVDGATLDVGAVAAVRNLRNPIEAARALLRDRPVLLVGEGASRYAEEHGLEQCEPAYYEPPQIGSREVCDTVGCVAFDQAGNLASGTSTGGLEGVRPGRVGDSPIPGCGLAAENSVGAVSFSGDGESILRLTLAARVMHDLPSRGPQKAAEHAIGQLVRIGGEAGCIVLGADGGPGVDHNSDHFAFGFASPDHPAAAYLHKGEFNHG